jgi:hypothetical protein
VAPGHPAVSPPIFSPNSTVISPGTISRNTPTTLAKDGLTSARASSNVVRARGDLPRLSRGENHIIRRLTAVNLEHHDAGMRDRVGPGGPGAVHRLFDAGFPGELHDAHHHHEQHGGDPPSPEQNQPNHDGDDVHRQGTADRCGDTGARQQPRVGQHVVVRGQFSPAWSNLISGLHLTATRTARATKVAMMTISPATVRREGGVKRSGAAPGGPALCR